MVRRYGLRMTLWLALSPWYILNYRLNNSEDPRSLVNVLGAGSRSHPILTAGAAAAMITAGWIIGGGAGIGNPCCVVYSTRLKYTGWPGSSGSSGSLFWTSSTCSNCASRTGSSCPCCIGSGSSGDGSSYLRLESDDCALGWCGSVSDGDSVGPVWPVSAANGDKEGSAASDETPSSILSRKVVGSQREHWDIPIACAIVVWWDLWVFGDIRVTCVYFEFVPIVVNKLDWIVCLVPWV